MPSASELATYACPSCPSTVQVHPASTFVGHRCRNARGNAMVQWVRVVRADLKVAG